MPNRMIREGLVTSERVAQLSLAAEVFFTHLMLVADDNGVHPADPELLKGSCYAKRPQVRTTDIVRWIAECEKADLIAAYNADDGKRYLIISRFNQRLRHGLRGKYPLPRSGPHDAPGQLWLTAPPPAANPPSELAPPLEEKRSRSRREEEPALPEGFTQAFVDAWQRYVEHRRTLRLKPLQPLSVAAQFRKFEGWGEAATIDAIETTIANGWQGIFPPRGTPAGRGTPSTASEYHDKF